MNVDDTGDSTTTSPPDIQAVSFYRAETRS